MGFSTVGGNATLLNQELIKDNDTGTYDGATDSLEAIAAAIGGKIYFGITVAPSATLTLNNDVLCIGDITVGAGGTLIINGNCHATGNVINSGIIWIKGDTVVNGTNITNTGAGTYFVIQGTLTAYEAVFWLDAGTASQITGDCNVSLIDDGSMLHGIYGTLWVEGLLTCPTINLGVGSAFVVGSVLASNDFFLSTIHAAIKGDCIVQGNFDVGEFAPADIQIGGNMTMGLTTISAGSYLVINGSVIAPSFITLEPIIGSSFSSMYVQGNMDITGAFLTLGEGASLICDSSLTCNDIFLDSNTALSCRTLNCYGDLGLSAGNDGIVITITGGCQIMGVDGLTIGAGTSGVMDVAGNCYIAGPVNVNVGAVVTIVGYGYLWGVITNLGTLTYNAPGGGGAGPQTIVDAVYVDTVNGVAGTTGTIGTPTNPVNNEADMLTILAARKINNISVINDLTLTVSHTYGDITVDGNLTIATGATCNVKGETQIGGNLIIQDGGNFNSYLDVKATMMGVGAGTSGTFACYGHANVASIVLYAGALFICALSLTCYDLDGSNDSVTINIGGNAVITQYLKVGGGTSGTFHCYGNLNTPAIQANNNGVVIVVGGNCTATQGISVGGGTSGTFTCFGSLESGTITLNTSVHFTSGALTCSGNFNAGYDGVTVTVNGNADIARNFDIGIPSGTSAGAVISGNLQVADNEGIFIGDGTSVIVYGNCTVTGTAGIDVGYGISGSLTVNGSIYSLSHIYLNTGVTFTSADLKCGSDFNAGFDGVNVTVNGNADIAGAFSLGGGTSGSLTVNGSVYSSSGGISIASGATLTCGNVQIDQGSIISLAQNAMLQCASVICNGFFNAGNDGVNITISGDLKCNGLSFGITGGTSAFMTVNGNYQDAGPITIGDGTTFSVNGSADIAGSFILGGGSSGSAIVYGEFSAVGGITLNASSQLTTGDNSTGVTGIVLGTGCTFTTGSCTTQGAFTANADGVFITINGDCSVAGFGGLTLGGGSSGVMSVSGKLEVTYIDSTSNLGSITLYDGTIFSVSNDCHVSGSLTNTTGTVNIYGDLYVGGPHPSPSSLDNTGTGTIAVSGNTKIATHVTNTGGGKLQFYGKLDITGDPTASPPDGYLDNTNGLSVFIGNDCHISGALINNVCTTTINGDANIGNFTNTTGAVIVHNIVIAGNFTQSGAGTIYTANLKGLGSLSNAGTLYCSEVNVWSTITNTGSLSCLTLIGGAAFDAGYDSVTVTINGDCKVAGSFTLGRGTSGTCIIAGNFSCAAAVTVAAGASLTYVTGSCGGNIACAGTITGETHLIGAGLTVDFTGSTGIGHITKLVSNDALSLLNMSGDTIDSIQLGDAAALTIAVSCTAGAVTIYGTGSAVNSSFGAGVTMTDKRLAIHVLP
jgi:hypothetical protein